MLVQSLHPVRSHVVSAGKNLYLPSARGSKALFWKVNVPADATEEQKADVFNNPDLEKCRTEICKFVSLMCDHATPYFTYNLSLIYYYFDKFQLLKIRCTLI